MRTVDRSSSWMRNFCDFVNKFGCDCASEWCFSFLRRREWQPLCSASAVMCLWRFQLRQVYTLYECCFCFFFFFEKRKYFSLGKIVPYYMYYMQSILWLTGENMSVASVVLGKCCSNWMFKIEVLH